MSLQQLFRDDFLWDLCHLCYISFFVVSDCFVVFIPVSSANKTTDTTSRANGEIPVDGRAEANQCAQLS